VANGHYFWQTKSHITASPDTKLNTTKQLAHLTAVPAAIRRRGESMHVCPCMLFVFRDGGRSEMKVRQIRKLPVMHRGLQDLAHMSQAHMGYTSITKPPCGLTAYMPTCGLTAFTPPCGLIHATMWTYSLHATMWTYSHATMWTYRYKPPCGLTVRLRSHEQAHTGYTFRAGQADTDIGSLVTLHVRQILLT
jgi:hypothetical protein